MQTTDSISINMPFKQNSEVFKLKQILSSGLFSIQPMVKKITKSQLKLLSTPGVAQVCLAIERDAQSANEYSIRGKSIAIVSRGGLLNTSGNSFLPVMDWFVAQIKFYSNIDCYPFVIRPTAPLEQVIKDLSNSFRGVLFLDNQPIPMIVSNINFFILSHWNVCEQIQCQKTDSEASSYILARLIKSSFNGIVSKQKIFQFLQEGALRVSRSELQNFELQIDGMQDVTPLKLHKAIQGKITVSLNFQDIQPLKKIFTLQNILQVIETNPKCNCHALNAIVTDGTAVLGLGNIGPMAGLPVMQAKSMIFKAFGGVQVVPVCINPRQNTDDTVSAILDLVYLYKAVNMEDFRSPECFSIQRKMKLMSLLPVFHDDQHGTAIATLAAFINATKLAKLVPSQCKVVINGAGAAGISITKILYEFGVRNLIVCDRAGMIYKGRRSNMNQFKEQISQITNFQRVKGTLSTAIIGANIFIGVSTKDTFKKQWVKKMCPKPIIFAMANPDPQISRSDAMQQGCFMYGCGRAGEPNQITNSLVYPGIFKAINQYGISLITPEMEVLAAFEIAKSVKGQLSTDNFMPSCLNFDIAVKIAQKLGQKK